MKAGILAVWDDLYCWRGHSSSDIPGDTFIHYRHASNKMTGCIYYKMGWGECRCEAGDENNWNVSRLSNSTGKAPSWVSALLRGHVQLQQYTNGERTIHVPGIQYQSKEESSKCFAFTSPSLTLGFWRARKGYSGDSLVINALSQLGCKTGVADAPVFRLVGVQDR